MLEFFRISLATALCHCRSDPSARSNRRKQKDLILSQCQINERVKEETANDQEVYRMKNIQKTNKTEENQFGTKRQLDGRKSPQQKLPPQDKSTTCSVRMASFGTQTTEEWKFKSGTIVVSKATQTPLFATCNEETNGKKESEENLKLQAWKDAKFFVTNQLLAQCLHTPNCTEI
ncbi:unnamed protein product [Cercopithifilaria johnstoni]|uniref:Uncharacterized protein n=1 Tax=Cercopithifilaria johnstoni TaxID=2874296 RepID=A0A8J2QAW4_9BILA|nr:unnamed protein product [Cercopithifilaria johnstoni]